MPLRAQKKSITIAWKSSAANPPKPKPAVALNAARANTKLASSPRANA
jgi:hypothetical protein